MALCGSRDTLILRVSSIEIIILSDVEIQCFFDLTSSTPGFISIKHANRETIFYAIFFAGARTLSFTF